jgi:hypothetical protein
MGKLEAHKDPPCHDLSIFPCESFPLMGGTTMPTAKVRASTILSAFEDAQSQLVGKAVALTNGMAGTVQTFGSTSCTGLRVSILGHDGKWPVSTIKFLQAGFATELPSVE